MENLLPLLLLACPVGMALMMLFMAKGMKSPKSKDPVSLADLKGEQTRLDEQIIRLEKSPSGDDVRTPAARH